MEAVGPEDWTWLPPGGGRTILEIANHVAGALFMFENHAFGDGALTWEDSRWRQQRSIEEMTAWLREAHGAFREHVAKLSDDQLLEPRRTHWGELRETRRIIASMTEHGVYHAGEINLIRALHQGDDKWS